jgi:hypothetical protein
MANNRDKDAGLEVRPEVVQQLRASSAKPRSEMLTPDEMWRKIEAEGEDCLVHLAAQRTNVLRAVAEWLMALGDSAPNCDEQIQSPGGALYSAAHALVIAASQPPSASAPGRDDHA